MRIQIAKKVGITGAFVGQILNGKNRPRYKTAKKLAEATNTNLILWLEGSPDEMKKALKETEQEINA